MIIIIIGFYIAIFHVYDLLKPLYNSHYYNSILFIITDNYRAPPRYMTDTYIGAYYEYPYYL